MMLLEYKGFFMKSDRIVIGADNCQATDLPSNLYSFFNYYYKRLVEIDLCSSELTTYAANAMPQLKPAL